MGLSARREKQKIGDDPRNTRWAKDESNPGFKLLSSMGWSPSRISLGLGASSNESNNNIESNKNPNGSSWKKLPTSTLPIIKSSNLGLGCNPNQSSSSILGAPRFVRATMSDSQQIEKRLVSDIPDETEEERAKKLSIVGTSSRPGGGFDDLFARLNAVKSKKPEKEDLAVIETRPACPDEERDIKQNKKSKKRCSSSEPMDDINDQGEIVDEHDYKQQKKNKKNRNKNKNKRVRIIDSSLDQSTGEQVVDQTLEVQRESRKQGRNDSKSLSPNKAETKKQKKNSKEEAKRLKKTSRCNSKCNLSILLSSPIKSKSHNEDSNPKNNPTSIVESLHNNTLKISRPINPRMAARAKYVNSKRLANSANSKAMAEILGVVPV